MMGLGRDTARLQRWGLTLTRGLPPTTRARWLTTLYGAYQVLRGQGEAWVTPQTGGAPYCSRLRGGYRVARLHLQGHILPEVWRSVQGGAGGAHPPLPPRARRADPSLFPDWMLEDLRALATVEPGLYPSPDFLARFYRWQAPPQSAPGTVYADLWGRLQGGPYDVIVLAPWLREGGADKGVLQYLDFYATVFPRVLLITTRPEDSPWRTRVAPGVEILEAGWALASLCPEDQETVLFRLLLERAPALLHGIQSDLGWRVVSRWGAALQTHYLPTARDHLDGILTDNRPYARQLITEFALDPQKVWPVPFWVADPVTGAAPAPREAGDSPHILWVSRFCLQKRPDILFEVARALPSVVFDVYGTPDRETGALYRKLQRLRNVRVHGAYGCFEDLVREQRFDAFLYTTDSDGLPNVLLEAAQAGLPIVCPAHIGGLRDLIGPESGYPVAETNTAIDYQVALQSLLANPGVAQERAKRAALLCRTRHTRAAFTTTMATLVSSFGYGSPLARPADQEAS